MMMRRFLAAALSLTLVDAATKVAVIELGKSGVVHRSTTSYSETSAEGVVSFFSSLHGYGRKLQNSGMTVVPDLFNKPDSGVVVSLSGVDLDSMPQVDAMMTNEGENGVVGHFEVEGSRSSSILKSIKDVEEVDSESLNEKVLEKATAAKGIFAVKLAVKDDNASDIDARVATLVQNMQKHCHKSGKTVVLHLVVEEEEGSARRRLTSRRLSEDDNSNSQDQDGDQNNGYYGYGYYNAYGEWVTPYKTMFQIQYFNIVLWTSLGLFGVLVFCLMLMINMPLMADTLLFGETAKVPLDE